MDLNRAIDISLIIESIQFPSFLFQKIDDNITLLTYNAIAKKALGDNASQIHKSYPEIIVNLNRCFNKRTSFSKEAKSKIYLNNKARFLFFRYNFIPPDLVLIYIEDITNYIKTEEKLVKSKEKLKKLNESFLQFSDDPISNIQILVNTVGELLEADSAIYNRLIKVNGEIILKTLAIWQEPPYYLYEDDPLGHICTDLIDRNPDDVVILKDLDKTTYAITDLNVKNYDLKQYCGCVVKLNNKPIGAFCVVYTRNRKMSDVEKDILRILSRSTSIEEQRWQANQFLKESEENYRLITEYANDLISIVNLKYEHEFINEETYQNLLGYSKKEILGKTGLSIVHPDDLKRGLKAYKEGLLKGEGTVEIRLRHKKGFYKWFEFRGKKYVDPKGNLKGLLIGRDITERKEAERLILEENKKLLELEKMREDIITRVSHELKTPLTPIVTGSELLLKVFKNQLGKDAQEIIAIIEKNGLRLKALIEDLLDASRIDCHTFNLTKTRENLVGIIYESIEALSFFVKNRQLTIKDSLPETIYFDIDKIRIKQAITNILSNAIKNTPKGRNIYINIDENLEYLDIKIKDTGVGLIKEEMRILFNKFGKIERYGKDLDVDIEGSGLGLYIARHIVNSHNGEILVESKGRNKGALFIIPGE